MKLLKYLAVLIFILLIVNCKKKSNENRVPLEQINIDRSSNYKYILKDVIEKQKKIEEAAKKDPFKD